MRNTSTDWLVVIFFFWLIFLVCVDVYLAITDKRKVEPVAPKCECKQPSFQEMMGIITRYGMYVDQYNYGKTKEERRIAGDSVIVYQKRYNIGQ